MTRWNRATWTPPTWLWGGDLPAFFNKAGLRTSKVAGKFEMQTEESYAKRPFRLLTLEALATPGAADRYFVAKDAAERATQIDMREGVKRLIEEMEKRHEGTRKLVDLTTYIRYQVSTVAADDLPELLKWSLEALRAIPMEDPSKELPFKNASTYALVRKEELPLRLVPAKIHLRLAQDERLKSGDRSHLNEAQLIFQGSANLLDGLSLLTSYIGPLMGALSPAVWAFYGARTFGPIIFTLGRAVAGTEGEPAELLQTLHNQGPDSSNPVPRLSLPAPGAALDWWCASLNNLLGVLTDPVNFTDQAGEFEPERQVHALSTVQQLFDRVAALQASHRDRDAREVLFYSTMDTVERLTGSNIERLGDLGWAESRLADLEKEIPASAAEVLLPRARDAVVALRAVQRGFYISPKSEGIDLLMPDGTRKRMSKIVASAQYLKLRRNATHGHGSNKSSQVQITNALLAQHDGKLDHGLGFLSYLYLLWILTRIDVLQRKWSHR